MSLEIVTLDGRSFRFREYEPPPLGDGEVRLRVDFAAPKHGTELHSLSGSAFIRKRWDPELRMFLPRQPDDPPPAPKERGIGNMVVGTVTETGSAVTRWKTGD